MSSLRALSDALAERLEGLSARLEQLGTGLKDAIARVVSSAAAEAARAAARALLDRLPGGDTGRATPPPWPSRDYDDEEYWYGREPTAWSDNGYAHTAYGPTETPDPGRTRRRLVFAAAVQVLSTVWDRVRRLPTLIAAGAGLAAGLLAAPAGPALAAGASATAAALALVSTTDLARRAVAALGRIFAFAN